MSAAPAAVEELAEGYQESLAERTGRGPLPVEEALRYATQVATCLRDLHMQGLIYGAVSSQLILLGPSGASLRSSGSLAQLGEPQHDVADFGRALGEMLRSVEGPAILHIELGQLAIRCQLEAPDMQQVLITLRLLGLQARMAAPAGRRPVLVRRADAAGRPALKETVLQWASMARHWKPLASLVAFALTGK